MTGQGRAAGAVATWEYLIVSLPAFGVAKAAQGGSAAVEMLNREGAQGWEAVGVTVLAAGAVAVLLKRPVVSPADRGADVRALAAGQP